MASLCVFLGLVTLSHAYVNVALNKPAYQQNSYSEGNALYDASNAVDGLKSNLRYDGGQCTLSANGQQTATWWVNLTSLHSIHHITIYYRTDNVAWGPSNGFRGRFGGFSVYVSNTTNRLQGRECFKDTNFTLETIPSVFTTTCPVHGQYVIYYNERLPGVTYPPYYSPYAYNELCEVEVYGCTATGIFGPNCTIPCPEVNCQYCHIETGTCQGCKPGFKGYRCEQDCPAGYFGKECSMMCPETCKGCNNVNGSCDKGCHTGWRGDYCGIECSGSMFGDGCLSHCGNCALNSQCHHINGTCLNGCKPGYNSQFCNQQCPGSMFGDGCLSQCGQCALNSQCHHINGTCLNGCKPGYTSQFCNQHCDDNKFGERCINSCGHCLGSEQCHHINGTCLNGCDSGYQGELCRTECEVNYFGINCKEMCNVTCKGCNRTTGICDNGCKPGWKDVYCHKECSAGYFGENCASMCGHCLNRTLCHHVTGNCVEGCLPGYKEPTCKTACNQMKYGENCSMTCGHCIESQQCHHINGTCMNGCASGYQGLKCTEECDKHFGPNCREKCNTTCKSCDTLTGVCNNDCYPGWRGLFCHELCEFGSYGCGCNQECSTFCKRSRDCHHVSGNCKDGCKSGWQGLDCLEVSKLTVTEKKLTSEFNGILSAFCILLFLNGVAITYFAVKRYRNAKTKQPAIYQSNNAQKVREGEISNVYINENNRREYQELGEISKTETYDTLQEVAYKNNL